MRKIILAILILFFSTILMANKLNMCILKIMRYDNTEIHILCIDGYKWMITMNKKYADDYSKIKMEQMKRKEKGQIVLDTCKCD
jgi:hypothetical protein